MRRALVALFAFILLSGCVAPAPALAHDSVSPVADIHVVSVLADIDPAPVRHEAATTTPAPKPAAKTKPVSVVRGSAWVEKVRLCIVHRESHGDYTIRSHSTDPNGRYAYGAYQFQDFTFHSVTGLPGHASSYSKAIQDKAFYVLFNNGKGRRNWNYPPAQCW